MQFFFALFLALKLIVFPKPPTVPTLKWKNAGFYDLINPTSKTIEAKIECGAEYSTIIVVVPSQTLQEIELTALSGNPLISCRLTSYVVQREAGE